LYLICFVFQNGHSFGKLKATKTTSTASAFGAKTEAKTATSGLVVLQSKMGFHLSLNCKIIFYYRVCHGFRLTQGDDYFWVDFDHF
jgi:hypothetical protein